MSTWFPPEWDSFHNASRSCAYFDRDLYYLQYYGTGSSCCDSVSGGSDGGDDLRLSSSSNDFGMYSSEALEQVLFESTGILSLLD